MKEGLTDERTAVGESGGAVNGWVGGVIVSDCE